MKEPVYDTLLLSIGSVTRTDVERAIYTCGWDIGRLYVLSNDPSRCLLPDDLPTDLCVRPKNRQDKIRILLRVDAMIFIEPQDNPLSKDWLKLRQKKLTYHYYPELFPRN